MNILYYLTYLVFDDQNNIAPLKHLEFFVN